MLKIGIIGGTGLENPDFLKNEIGMVGGNRYGRVQSIVRTGTIGNVSVVLLSRHDQRHTYSPTQVNYRANIQQLKNEGCTHIIATSACGSLREWLTPGCMVIPNEFIDFTNSRNNTFFESFEYGVNHTSLADPFDETLSDALDSACQFHELNWNRGGTVVTIEGPRFSTSAESLMYKIWGADVINMTTATEASLAKEIGIPYAVLCMVTDYDSWNISEPPATMEIIRKVLSQNTESVLAVLTKTINTLEHIL